MKAWVLILWLCPAWATAFGFSITSPDRPAIWYNRAGDKVSQHLDWDREKREVVLYVAYNTVEFMPLADQTYYNTFRLSFPMVRWDESTNRLYFIDRHGRRIDIGHVEPGIMGDRVVLNDDVRLSAQRSNGVIHAAIVSGEKAER